MDQPTDGLTKRGVEPRSTRLKIFSVLKTFHFAGSITAASNDETRIMAGNFNESAFESVGCESRPRRSHLHGSAQSWFGPRVDWMDTGNDSLVEVRSKVKV